MARQHQDRLRINRDETSAREPTVRGSERRKQRRFVVRGEAELHRTGADLSLDPPISIHLQDISLTGARLLCPRSLRPGTVWRLHVLNQGHVVGHQTLVIRHVRQHPTGLFLVGGQFCIEAGLMTVLGVNPDSLHGTTEEAA